MPARAPLDMPPHLTVTLRLPDVTGIPTLAGGHRASLRSRHTGSPADATPALQDPKRNHEMTNHLIIIGRLTRPATLRFTEDKARANFTIAVDGYNDKVDYLPVTVFGKCAENVAEYTDKGHLVAVEGRITSGKYTNDAGETIFTIDIIGQSVQFLSKPKATTTTPETVEGEAA